MWNKISSQSFLLSCTVITVITVILGLKNFKQKPDTEVLNSGTGKTGPWIAGAGLHSLPHHITLLKQTEKQKTALPGRAEHCITLWARGGCIASCNKTYRTQFSRVSHWHVLWAKQRAHDRAAKHWDLNYSPETENASSLMWWWAVPYHLVWPSKPLLALWIPKTPSLAPPIISFLPATVHRGQKLGAAAVPLVPRETLCGQQLP